MKNSKLSFIEKIIETIIIIVCLSLLGWFICSDMRNVSTLQVKNPASAYKGEKIDVTLDGEVKNPGVYSIDSGTTLYDFISQAGGVTDEADVSDLDFSAPLVSSGEIYVKRRDNGVVCESVSSSDLSVNIKSNASDENYTPENKCNINTANVSQLATLPSIGEKTAEKIIEYRESYGLFNSTEDIKHVSGIGDKKYEKFKDLIKVSD